MRITMIWAVLVKYGQTLTEFIDLLNWIKLGLIGFLNSNSNLLIPPGTSLFSS